MDENNIIEPQEDDFLMNEPETQADSAASGAHFLSKTTTISGMFQDWFLDYSSYVILERAVPNVFDGLKPVQRRILHAMKELDDGRYNKVANIIGHTMKYHPHGDTSIGDALVQLGQKELLIDCQGNWGNILTGDSAAAPRYIEARLSKFALEVVYNPKTTNWKRSYDGRNKEPITLPVKFPLLLAQGAEGIAVGLACKIFPHNFNELIDASINILKGKPFEIFPDFLTGGMVDCSRYNDGLRGGRLRVRARIKQFDKKTLIVTEVPFGKTTDSIIESIIRANDNGKIKIRKIDDNTAAEAEIVIHLAPNVSPDQTIDALYAFTDCEISIAPNSCVIVNEQPVFMPVSDILRHNTGQTKFLLQRELEIRLDELNADWHYSSLEKIFFEERIYKELEKDQDSWEEQLVSIEKAFIPFLPKLRQTVTRDDVLKLTEKPVRRISKFDIKKAEEHIQKLEEEMEEVKRNLENLTQYAIDYFLHIKKKYGVGQERRTEIRNFDNIEAVRVIANNEKLYFDRAEGFAGTALKKAEYICDCSDIDEIITFHANGKYKIVKVSPKFFVGTDVIHIAVFQKNDDRTIYNAIYQDGKKGNNYVKRFAVKSVVRDREYNLTKGTKDSLVYYFTANPNGEAETVKVILRPKPKLRKTSFDFDFSTVAIKSRTSQGNIISRHFIRKVTLKEDGVSTLGAVNIYYDDTVRRLNSDERGRLLGAFKGDDKILAIMQSGELKFHNFDLSNHFEEDMILIEKFNPDDVVTAVYYDGKAERFYLKRFRIEQPQLMKKILFISEEPHSKLLFVTLTQNPELEIVFDKKKNKTDVENEMIDAVEFVEEKSIKAKGKQISKYAVLSVIEHLPEPSEEDDDEMNPENEPFDNDDFIEGGELKQPTQEISDNEPFEKEETPDEPESVETSLENEEPEISQQAVKEAPDEPQPEIPVETPPKEEKPELPQPLVKKTTKEPPQQTEKEPESLQSAEEELRELYQKIQVETLPKEELPQELVPEIPDKLKPQPDATTDDNVVKQNADDIPFEIVLPPKKKKPKKDKGDNSGQMSLF